MMQESKMNKSKPFVRWRSGSAYRCPDCGAPIEEIAEMCDVCGAGLGEWNQLFLWNYLQEHRDVIKNLPQRQLCRACSKEELKDLFRAIFKDFAHEDSCAKSWVNADYRLFMDGIWGIVSPQNVIPEVPPKISLDESEKERLLLTMCMGQYKEDELIHIHVTDDLYSGWALTIDSVCFGDPYGCNIILYENIDQIDVKEEANNPEDIPSLVLAFKCKDGYSNIQLEDVGITQIEVAKALNRYLMETKRLITQ